MVEENNKEKFALWLRPETKRMVEKNYKDDGCRSRSDFIEKAIIFYCGYLTATDYAKLKTSGRLIRVEQYGPGLSDRMVRACHASCRSALQKAVEEGLIRSNPAIGCKLPPKKSGEMNILTQEEMQRFLIQAKQDG